MSRLDPAVRAGPVDRSPPEPAGSGEVRWSLGPPPEAMLPGADRAGSGWLRRLGRRPRRVRSRGARVLRARLRRAGAALLVGLAVAVGLFAWLPRSEPAGVEVLVAAHDLAGGQTVQAGDLVLRRRPADTVPAGALIDRAVVVGRVSAGPVRAGEVVTDARLVGPGMLLGRPAGEVVMSVPLLDGGLLVVIRPGHRVRVFTGPASVDAVVLSGGAGGAGAVGPSGSGHAGAADAGGGGSAGGAAGSAGEGRLLEGLGGRPGDGVPRLLVAVPAADAATLAAALDGPVATGGGLVVALLPG